MNFVLQPWQLLFVILAGWVNRQQQQVIEYLRTENQVLREKLGKRRTPKLRRKESPRELLDRSAHQTRWTTTGERAISQMASRPFNSPQFTGRGHHLRVRLGWTAA